MWENGEIIQPEIMTLKTHQKFELELSVRYWISPLSRHSCETAEFIAIDPRKFAVGLKKPDLVLATLGIQTYSNGVVWSGLQSLIIGGRESLWTETAISDYLYVSISHHHLKLLYAQSVLVV